MESDTHFEALGSVVRRNLGGRLGEHHLGQVAIDGFELGLALNAEDERVLALSVLSERCAQLREPLQAG